MVMTSQASKICPPSVQSETVIWWEQSRLEEYPLIENLEAEAVHSVSGEKNQGVMESPGYSIKRNLVMGDLTKEVNTAPL